MEIPIFPLNGAVLFPGTSLPLNIFESRYIEMIDYALARDRLIGMIQTDDKNNLYNIGCVGRIHSFNETRDGRYLISLLGTNCFKINKELALNYNFRRVSIEIIKESKINKDILSDQKKSKLLIFFKKFIEIKKMGIDYNEIENIEIGQVIKFIAMISPFTNIEKQLLLETLDAEDFYNKLISIIELEIGGNFENNSIN